MDKYKRHKELGERVLKKAGEHGQLDPETSITQVRRLLKALDMGWREVLEENLLSLAGQSLALLAKEKHNPRGRVRKDKHPVQEEEHRLRRLGRKSNSRHGNDLQPSENLRQSSQDREPVGEEGSGGRGRDRSRHTRRSSQLLCNDSNRDGTSTRS